MKSTAGRYSAVCEVVQISICTLNGDIYAESDARKLLHNNTILYLWVSMGGLPLYINPFSTQSFYHTRKWQNATVYGNHCRKASPKATEDVKYFMELQVIPELKNVQYIQWLANIAGFKGSQCTFTILHCLRHNTIL